MGVYQSTSAPPRKHLRALPSDITENHGANSSRSTDANPASTTGREIDSLLESHIRNVQSAMKPKLFRKDSKKYEKSSQAYSTVLGRLDATLSHLFGTLLKLSGRMVLEDWQSK